MEVASWIWTRTFCFEQWPLVTRTVASQRSAKQSSNKVYAFPRFFFYLLEAVKTYWQWSLFLYYKLRMVVFLTTPHKWRHKSPSHLRDRQNETSRSINEINISRNFCWSNERRTTSELAHHLYGRCSRALRAFILLIFDRYININI